jgi:hypothetical protein
MERVIDEILNISNSPAKTVEETQILVKQVEQNLATTFQPSETVDPRFEEDFEFTRDSLKELIEEVKKTVYRISMIASDTEKSMDFQAMAQMSTVLLSCNKQILDIYEMKKKYLTKKEVKQVPQMQPSGNVNVQNAAIFTGTTHELKKFIDGLKNSGNDS